MHFIVFGHFSQQGVEKVMNVVECTLEMRTILQSIGGQVLELYYTLGTYDFVAIIEAPDEKSMLKAMMEVAKFGTMRTETLVAVPARETAELIK